MDFEGRQSRLDRFKRWLASLKVTRQKWREWLQGSPARDAQPDVGFNPLPGLPGLLDGGWDTWQRF